MADPKKNPLLGVFKAPDPPKEEKPPTPADPPKVTPAPAAPAKAEPPKATEDKKPTAPDKGDKDGKTTAAPAKAEDKKPVEPPKAAEEKKPTAPDKGDKDGKAPATPAKGEDKKPTEPPKAAEEKKPTAPNKGDKDGKDPATPAKAGDKKPAEPPKTAEEKKPTVPDKGDKDGKAPAAPAKAEDKKPAEPPKAADGKKPPEKSEATEELDEDGIPKDFSMEIVNDKKLGQVTKMAIDLIDDFEGHPFPVRDDADMDALVKSIKQVGILEPATIIRKPKNFGRFEMVAGHRRMHAAKLAGLTHIPVIVRDMDHDEATIYMVDSNLKREIPLTTMEKARAYTMRSEALKRKTGRRSNEEKKLLEATGQKPKTADEQIAEQTGESVAQVQRLKTLTKLNPELQEKVDKKELPVNTAVDIAQLKPEEQKKLADAIDKEGGTVPSGSKAKELKEASKAGTLTPEKIEAAVAPTKREVEPPLKVTLMEEDLAPYFKKGTLVPEVKQGIFQGLELRKKLMERQAAQSKAGKDPKKKPPAPAR